MRGWFACSSDLELIKSDVAFFFFFRVIIFTGSENVKDVDLTKEHLNNNLKERRASFHEGRGSILINTVQDINILSKTLIISKAKVKVQNEIRSREEFYANGMSEEKKKKRKM